MEENWDFLQQSLINNSDPNCSVTQPGGGLEFQSLCSRMKSAFCDPFHHFPQLLSWKPAAFLHHPARPIASP